MMPKRRMDRREFVRNTAATAAGIAAGAAGLGAARRPGSSPPPKPASILNYNENMEYRRLGKTGLMVSAVSLGGHWKRVNTMGVPKPKGGGWFGADIDNPEFQKNRREIVSYCIDAGINYVDACSGDEVMAYARALKGRREKMYIGYSWYEYEMRFHPWRDSLAKMMEGLDRGLKQSGLAYVDFWRISMEVDTGRKQTQKEVEIAMEALAKAKKQGKARFIGVSSHDRPWLKKAIETYPEQMEAILTPYTASSRELPKDSVFEAVRKHDVGVFGIKPFASNSLFAGSDMRDDQPHTEQTDRLARMAIRYILSNPAITAPIPGLINFHQVDNVVRAVKERRELEMAEMRELEKATGEMWARLPREYEWLRDWKYV